MDEMYVEADSMKTKIGGVQLVLSSFLYCIVTCLSAALESSKRELDRTQAELCKKISKPFSGEWRPFLT